MKRLLAICLFSASFILLMGYYFYPSAKITLAKPTSIPVKTAKVVVKTMPYIINTSASTDNNDAVTISPEIAGIISNIHFKAGQRVKTGEVLIELDDRIFKQELQTAKANFNLSKLNYERAFTLSKKQLISQQNLDEAKADFMNKQNIANVKQTQVNKMRLVAPFTGHMGKRAISLGAFVSVGQSLATLVSNDILKVQYRIPATFLPRIKLGQQVKLHSDIYPDETFKSTIVFIDPSVDPETRSLYIEASFDNADHKLTSGLFLTVTHLLDGNKKMLVVPEESLIPTITGEKIYIIKKNQAHSVIVKTGLHDHENVEVIEGLHPGDTVVIHGHHKLHDGSLVTVSNS